MWTLDNRGAAAQRVEASYLTGNMNWNADYVLTVGRDEKTADLDGWVTLVNNSGAAYTNAKLQLVAGQVHRTPRITDEWPRRMHSRMRWTRWQAAPAIPAGIVFGISLYTLDRRTSIQNNESKQISLLSGTNVPVEKYLSVEGQQYYYRNSQGIGNPIPQPVKVYYRFKNDEKSNLGMPLPAGTVRVYQADSKGGTQFAGEDNIGHTPKDETVHIYVGDAFDVVCERKQMDYKRLANNLFEMEYQITLRNHKDGPVTVEVREPVGGDWEVVNSNYKSDKARCDHNRFRNSGGEGRNINARLSRAREVVEKQWQRSGQRLQQVCLLIEKSKLAGEARIGREIAPRAPREAHGRDRSDVRARRPAPARPSQTAADSGRHPRRVA